MLDTTKDKQSNLRWCRVAGRADHEERGPTRGNGHPVVHHVSFGRSRFRRRGTSMIRRNGFGLIFVVAGLLVAGLVPALTRTTTAQDATPTQVTIETKFRFLHASPEEDNNVKVIVDDDLRISRRGVRRPEPTTPMRQPAKSGSRIQQDGALDLFDVLYSAVYPAVPAGNYYQVVMTDDLVISSVVDRSRIP